MPAFVLASIMVGLASSTPGTDGGLAGGGPITTHEHGEHCISDIDRAHVRDGMARYVEQFGPLSVPGERGEPALFSIYPVGGILWDELLTTNFVDLDPGSGILDWNCGAYTYNGHDASDTCILSFEHQFIGVPVVSVLDGTVVDTHDGEPDQNTQWEGQPANYVIIDHGQGRVCKYWHLKQWSVAVSPGQQVRAGEEIGLMASSGNSSWPHLHFTTEDDGVVTEPYTGDCNPGESQWVEQVEIPTETDCLDFGVTVESLSDFYANNTYHWRAPTDGQVPFDHEYVWIWTQGTNLPAGSTCRFRFYDPSGSLYFDSGILDIGFSTVFYSWWFAYFNWDLPALHTTPGTWTVDLSINGEPYVLFPLEVVEEVDPGFNQAPQPVAAEILPSSPAAEDILTCQLATEGPLDDLDWDLVRFQYTWSIGGRVVRDTVSAGLADHLPRLEACDGSVVQCIVIPSDGTDSGASTTVKVRLSGESLGDVNCDGSIDVVDLLVVLDNWGSCGLCPGDLNGDGEADVNDVLTLIANWG